VIEPFPAFAIQAAPKPIATATGSVPTTSVRKTRFDSGFVAIRRSVSPSTVHTSPAPSTTLGGRGPGPCRFTSVSSVRGLSTRSESGFTLRGARPTTNSRFNAAAMPPSKKITPIAIRSRLRVQRVG
jgi:hypothetical protein